MLPALRVHTNIPSPYRKHQFERLSEVFPRTRVYFYDDMEAGRPWSTDLSGWKINFSCMKEKLSLGKASKLRFGRFGGISIDFLRDLLRQPWGTIHLVGYGISGLEWWILWFSGLVGWSKVVELSDGMLQERITPPTMLTRFKLLGHRYCFIPGKRGHNAALLMGFKPKNIYNAYFSHDAEAFNQYYLKNYLKDRETTRKNNKILNDHLVVLTISRFLDWKRLEDAAKALHIIEHEAPELAKKMTYVLIGDGQCISHESLLESLKTIRIVHHVQMPYEEVLSWYCASDLFVLPSEGDIWGLVVNEALSMRLPVICTDAIGASELIENDVNGFVVTRRSPHEIAHNIIKILHCEKNLHAMKKAAGEILNSWKTEFGVQELIRLAYGNREG
jgi:glycosyltransferase involved in cell wall biosynthesis